MRRTPLQRHGRMRARPPAPGEREWKTARFGRCRVCGAIGLVERHHVVYAQHLRGLAPERMWDQRGALDDGHRSTCRCHGRHHTGADRISVRRLPDRALAFAAEVLGGSVGAYLSRYYAP